MHLFVGLSSLGNQPAKFASFHTGRRLPARFYLNLHWDLNNLAYAKKFMVEDDGGDGDQ